MTFEQFQATRRKSDDLARDTGSASWIDPATPPKGFVYEGGLHIEELTDGEYCLTIGNVTQTSRDLGAMERELFAFGESEGMFE